MDLKVREVTHVKLLRHMLATTATAPTACIRSEGSVAATTCARGDPAPPSDDTTTERAGQDTPSGRLAYSVDEAARLAGLSRDLLYDEMHRGNLADVKVGRRRLITRQHLQQLLGIAS
jgi:excisionase family DNA binding protein